MTTKHYNKKLRLPSEAAPSSYERVLEWDTRTEENLVHNFSKRQSSVPYDNITHDENHHYVKDDVNHSSNHVDDLRSERWHENAIPDKIVSQPSSFASNDEVIVFGCSQTCIKWHRIKSSPCANRHLEIFQNFIYVIVIYLY